LTRRREGYVCIFIGYTGVPGSKNKEVDRLGRARRDRTLQVHARQSVCSRRVGLAAGTETKDEGQVGARRLLKGEEKIGSRPLILAHM